jgi:hypothetical protein
MKQTIRGGGGGGLQSPKGTTKSVDRNGSDEIKEGDEGGIGIVYIPDRGLGWNEGRGRGLRSSALPWAKQQLTWGQPSLPLHNAHSFVLYAGPWKGGGPDAFASPLSLGPFLKVPGQ